MFVILTVVGVIAFSTLGAGLIAPLAFVGVTFLEGHFVTPTIIGRRLELNALAVFMALAFWTWLWGPMGGFLSSPLLIVGADPQGASDAGGFAAIAAGLIVNDRISRSGTSRGTGRVCAVRNSGTRELLMSSTDGEIGMRNMTDKATYERLEKDVTAVKNDISALTDQITDALNSFAGTARSRRAAATSRPAPMPIGRRRHVGARQRHDGCGAGRGLFDRGDRWKTSSRSARWRPLASRSASAS